MYSDQKFKSNKSNLHSSVYIPIITGSDFLKIKCHVREIFAIDISDWIKLDQSLPITITSTKVLFSAFHCNIFVFLEITTNISK